MMKRHLLRQLDHELVFDDGITDGTKLVSIEELISMLGILANRCPFHLDAVTNLKAGKRDNEDLRRRICLKVRR